MRWGYAAIETDHALRSVTESAGGGFGRLSGRRGRRLSSPSAVAAPSSAGCRSRPVFSLNSLTLKVNSMRIQPLRIHTHALTVRASLIRIFSP